MSSTPEPQETAHDAKEIGTRIRAMRTEKGLSLTELANRAGVSKSYLSTVENGTGTRLGAAVLHKLALALGVTLGDVLGRGVRVNTSRRVPDSLRAFADQRGLPEADITMLAGIQFRGEAPKTPTRWGFIYDAIVMSAQSEERSDG